MQKTISAARLFACLFLLLVLSGCSNQKSSSPTKKATIKPAELVPLNTGYSIATLWSAKVGKGSTVRFGGLTVAVAGERVYAADVNGNVGAYRIDDGVNIWHIRIPSLSTKPAKRKDALKSFISAGPSIKGDRLFLGTVHGEVIALGSAEGDMRWRVQLSSEVLSAPQSNGNLVFAQTIDGKLSALQADDGSRVWNYDNPVPRLSLRGSSRPVVFGDMVLAGFASGKLSVLDAEQGEAIWEERVALPQGRSELARIVDVDSTPLVVDGFVYAASYQGAVKAFYLRDGRIVWEKEFSTAKDLATGFNQIYAIDESDSIFAIDRDSGDVVWVNESLRGRQLSSPVAFSNYLAVGDKQGYLHIISQLGGLQLARIRIGKQDIQSTSAGADNRLYVLAADGQLQTLQVRSPG